MCQNGYFERLVGNGTQTWSANSAEKDVLPWPVWLRWLECGPVKDVSYSVLVKAHV